MAIWRKSSCEKLSDHFAKVVDAAKCIRYTNAQVESQELRDEMLNAIDLFRLSADRMRYLTERQTVIARNIANADTPGYKAQDLAAPNFDSALLRAGSTSGGGVAPPLALARTEAGHLSSSPETTFAQQALTTPNASEKPDGNTVSLDEQMEKSADIANAFALASAVYTKSVSLMKIAIDNK